MYSDWTFLKLNPSIITFEPNIVEMYSPFKFLGLLYIEIKYLICASVLVSVVNKANRFF